MGGGIMVFFLMCLAAFLLSWIAFLAILAWESVAILREGRALRRLRRAAIEARCPPAAPDLWDEVLDGDPPEGRRKGR